MTIMKTLRALISFTALPNIERYSTAHAVHLNRIRILSVYVFLVNCHLRVEKNSRKRSVVESFMSTVAQNRRLAAVVFPFISISECGAERTIISSES